MELIVFKDYVECKQLERLAKELYGIDIQIPTRKVLIPKTDATKIAARTQVLTPEMAALLKPPKEVKAREKYKRAPPVRTPLGVFLNPNRAGVAHNLTYTQVMHRIETYPGWGFISIQEFEAEQEQADEKD